LRVAGLIAGKSTTKSTATLLLNGQLKLEKASVLYSIPLGIFGLLLRSQRSVPRLTRGEVEGPWVAQQRRHDHVSRLPYVVL
jgi:peptidoglycan biosynthesis protein MviN/MurJ (putative lipid II flippase)